MGIDSLPFLSVGEDTTGREIQDYLLNIIIEKRINKDIEKFVKSEDFCVPNATTSHATIIVQNSQRTIFSQRANELDRYRNLLPKRLNFARDLGFTNASGVIIGHLSCDNCDCKSGLSSGTECATTLIRKFKRKAPVLVNFGKSQLNRGFSYWKEKILTDVICQFNLSEAKLFFKGTIGENPSLSNILQFLRQNSITGVITLDRFGAVGNYQDGRNGVILAWPLLDSTQIVDPTGAGDAFAAGIMSYLKGKIKISFSDFFSSIEEGRNWSAYACTTYGGAAKCPNRNELQTFLDTYSFKGRNIVEFLNKESAEQIISLIDMAYR